MKVRGPSGEMKPGGLRVATGFLVADNFLPRTTFLRTMGREYRQGELRCGRRPSHTFVPPMEPAAVIINPPSGLKLADIPPASLCAGRTRICCFNLVSTMRRSPPGARTRAREPSGEKPK